MNTNVWFLQGASCINTSFHAVMQSLVCFLSHGLVITCNLISPLLQTVSTNTQDSKTAVKFNLSRQNIRYILSFQNHHDSDGCCSHDSLGQHDLQANMYGCPWAAWYSPHLTSPAQHCHQNHEKKTKKKNSQFHLTVTTLTMTVTNIICNVLPTLHLTNLMPCPAAISHSITIMRPVKT